MLKDKKGVSKAGGKAGICFLLLRFCIGNRWLVDGATRGEIYYLWRNNAVLLALKRFDAIGVAVEEISPVWKAIQNNDDKNIYVSHCDIADIHLVRIKDQILSKSYLRWYMDFSSRIRFLNFWTPEK